MEYRKLINFGNTSLVVSLPKEWLRQHKLNKGDVVYLENQPNCILLFPREREEKKVEKEYSINVDNDVLGTVKRKVIQTYIENYDTITFTGKSIGKHSKDIRNMVKRFVALEIIEESKNRIVARSFVNIKEANLEHNIQRIDNMIRTMMADLLAMPKMNKAKKAEISGSLKERDRDINKMIFLSYRYINYSLTQTPGSGKPSPAETLKNWYLFNNLERIGNDLKRISRPLVLIQKQNLLKEAEEILVALQKIYQVALKAVYTNNSEIAYKTSLERDPLLEQCEQFLERNTHNIGVIEFCERVKEMFANLHNILRLRY